MDTPLKNRPAPGPVPSLEARRRAAILGSVTLRGRAEEVSGPYLRDPAGTTVWFHLAAEHPGA